MAKSNVESAVEKQARVFVLTHYARKVNSPIMVAASNVAAARKWYGAVAARFLAAVRSQDNARLHATYAKGTR